MKRRLFVALLPVAALATLLGMSGCGRATDPWEGETGSPKVVVTLAPLYSFVKAVMGKEGAVRCICTSTGPHHYQTDTRDARLLQKADAIFGIGLQLDDTFTDSLITLARKKDIPYVKLGTSLPDKLKRNLKEEDDHKDDHKHADHKHEHGKHDPHVWLGIPQAIAMVGQIRDKLSEIDSAHKEDYEKNAKAYIKKLNGLVEEAPKNIKNKPIISFHDSLEYFAETFGITIAEVIEVAPGDEASSAHLRDLKNLCKKNDKLRVIAVEPQYPTTTSATILGKALEADGIKVALVPIDPLETAEADELKKEGAAWYLERMRKNLKELASAFK